MPFTELDVGALWRALDVVLTVSCRYSAPLYVDMRRRVLRQRIDRHTGEVDWDLDPDYASEGEGQDKVWIGKVTGFASRVTWPMLNILDPNNASIEFLYPTRASRQGSIRFERVSL